MASSSAFLTILLFLFTLCATLQQPGAAYRWRCHPEDKQILLDINKEFNNTILSWLPGSDCCKSWYGVKCDVNTSRVTELAIPVEASGRFPPSIGRVPYLQWLILHKMPNLTGELPPSLQNLKNLRYLWITWTPLTGPIPDWLGQMSSLTYINLAYNQFTGSIPPSLPEMPNLTYLRLDRNQLTGSIPATFSRFKGDSLFLSNNDLSGPVPEAIGRDANFIHIELQRNRLEGDPSHLFNGRSKSLGYIDLSRNLFSFDLSNVEIPASNLETVDLNHNLIRGSIPEAIVNVTNLKNFNVSYNRLCGRIPQGGPMLKFDRSSYMHNSCLCGPPLTATCPNH